MHCFQKNVSGPPTKQNNKRHLPTVNQMRHTPFGVTTEVAVIAFEVSQSYCDLTAEVTYMARPFPVMKKEFAALPLHYIIWHALTLSMYVCVCVFMPQQCVSPKRTGHKMRLGFTA